MNYESYFKSLDIDLLPITPLMNFKPYFEIWRIDGIILSGGNNIGECKLRDEQENKLLDYAIKYWTPILGICRGMQFINKYFGGTTSVVKNHVNAPHDIKIKSTLWRHAAGSHTAKVNSFHDYGITTKDLSDKLRTTCIAFDNIIEALEHPEYPITGVQWHPERAGNSGESDIFIIKLLEKRL